MKTYVCSTSTPIEPSIGQLTGVRCRKSVFRGAPARCLFHSFSRLLTNVTGVAGTRQKLLKKWNLLGVNARFWTNFNAAVASGIVKQQPARNGAACAILVVLLAFCPVLVTASPGFLPDDMQFHGFLTQGFFHSSDNNVYGQSDDGISPGQTEVGANLSYQPNDWIRFAGQGLFRRAGDVDRGSLSLDFAMVDITLLNYDSGKLGIRGGRIKTPFGLYNETRDVAFTHPTIMLPQGIYFDRSRSLLLSTDGGAFYAEQRTGFGDFSLKVNFGLPRNDLNEIRTLVLAREGVVGDFETRPTFAAQLGYEFNEGEYRLAVSYLDMGFSYAPGPGESLNHSKTSIRPLLFSAQYNGEDFTLTGEYQYAWNCFGNFAPEGRFASESWYLEGSYRILPALQATVRYDTIDMNVDERHGEGAARLGFPNYVAFTQTWVFGLRWDVTANWMVRGDYSRVHGVSWLPQADNPDPRATTQDWDLFGVQLSYKF